MGSQKPDLVGLRFGRLQVISDAGCIRRKGHSYHYYQCRCDCGNEPLVMKSNLIKGYTNSCGCLRQEVGRILMKERRKWEKLMKEEKARLVDKAQKAVCQFICACETKCKEPNMNCEMIYFITKSLEEE